MKKHFTKHPVENAVAHLFMGAGVGFLLTYPLAQSHPVRWGIACLVVGLAMHLKAAK